MAIPIESNISFYDSVAPEYNRHLSDGDNRAREMIADIFVKYVESGCVLDFGGGTGLDIPWLSGKYDLYFLEPSVNMRTVASLQADTHKVTFLPDDYTDYLKWQPDSLPLSAKVDGVLANFAVLNCIEFLGPLFEKISLLMLNGAYLFATIIDPRPVNILRHHGLVQAIQTAINGKSVVYNRHRDKLHPTFLHSRKSILSASDEYFDLRDQVPLPATTFSLFIFRRK